MNEITNDDRLKAAYALNLCTVSVSQIIDYNDINVLEQEYEAILNNLNLEHMPHDEALLFILKQLMDTITFFRIREGDKKILDMKYRQKMKNAIWDAVPNFGLFVAGTNPFTLAISIASQVGIGYMNYRKNKAANDLEYQEQQWQLQRTALEQFNGLRRELFDTAWRLADTYGFSDEMRLTERQIKHYDDILMDSNVLRRYDRLDSVKSNFTAYPPFWYYMGNTANEIARNRDLKISDDTRTVYRENAKKYFAKYWETNKYPLLREDQIASACALEYADLLLEDGAEKSQVIDLIDKAVKYSGDAWDVLQLCAIGYLRANEQDRAIPILRILVNEKYNASLNTQILSGIYVGQFTRDGNQFARVQYEILSQRISNPMNLVPWPKEGVDAQTEFNNNQRSMLLRRCQLIIKAIRDKYTIKFNKLLPGPSPYEEYDDSFFCETNKKKRIEKMERVFNIVAEKQTYKNELMGNAFSYKYVDTFNDLIEELNSLKLIDDMNTIVEICKNIIEAKTEQLAEIQQKMLNGEFDIDSYKKTQDILSDKDRDGLFDEVQKQLSNAASDMSDMSEFAAAITKLSEYCAANDIEWPELKPDAIIANGDNSEKSFIGYDVLGSELGAGIFTRTDVIRKIIDTSVRESIINDNKVALLMKGDTDFNKYFRRTSQNIAKDYKSDTLAILDDHAAFVDLDILFTATGYVCVTKDTVAGMNSYDVTSYDGEAINFSGLTFTNKYIDLEKLYSAIMELSHTVKR